MIHYHGTPCGATRNDVARFLAGRHALIPYPRPEDIATAAEVCQSFAMDNGAFSIWKASQCSSSIDGKAMLHAVMTIGKHGDWSGYYRWVEEWRLHPGFDWAIIPDVIDGDEQANDDLLAQWPWDCDGVPVWHLYESLERLDRLVSAFPRVALGSSGKWSTPGTDGWWRRMAEAMDVACEDGRPRCRLHGLRMLDPAIFHRLPLASADSTNAVRNSSSAGRFGMYSPPNASTRMGIIAERIEAHQSAAIWQQLNEQKYLLMAE